MCIDDFFILGGVIMQGYNVVVVFNKEKNKLLMCKRKRNPYKGLNNLVGGKIEQNENGIK
jgi:8-oxo-dGTP diphosphatase